MRSHDFDGGGVLGATNTQRKQLLVVRRRCGWLSGGGSFFAYKYTQHNPSSNRCGRIHTVARKRGSGTNAKSELGAVLPPVLFRRSQFVQWRSLSEESTRDGRRLNGRMLQQKMIIFIVFINHTRIHPMIFNTFNHFQR
uniref:Uncharacterized protein n=1 Tax=Globodera rostochiensis TaxID=31243 RepID=A0A914HXR7_GLORO